MWLDRVSNPGPLAFELDALPTTLRGPAIQIERKCVNNGACIAATSVETVDNSISSVDSH